MSNIMKPVQDCMAEYADRALSQYAMTVSHKRFIRHNENLVYQVTDTCGRNYLLRIHLPKNPGFKGIQQERDAIESELLWLQAIRRDTGIEVQEPLPNRNGEWVTRIVDCPGLEDVNCTLLTWIDAEPFAQDHIAAEQHAFQIGALVARLHKHARNWMLPPHFRRLVYDETLLVKALADLQTGIPSGIVANADFQAISQAAEGIARLFAETGKSDGVWGLIHADYLSGNLLIRGENLIPIDFSLSGFGFYMLDLAICLSSFKKHLRQPFLNGFGEVLTQEQRYMIESQMIYIILISASRNVTNPDWSKWFARRFPLIAGDYCRRLEKREPFMFEI